MKKLDIINELRHIQEMSRTSANVLTSIIRQLEKEKPSPKPPKKPLEKKGQNIPICPVILE